MSRCSGEEQRATRNAPGVQGGENSHTQPAVNWSGRGATSTGTLTWGGRRDWRTGMPTPLLKSNDCKYCLSRPRRQADHMHHVETFTKSVKFFSSTISWGFSALWSFPSKECTFCRTSQGYYFSNSPLNPPSPKYSSSFFLIITFPFLLLLLRLLVAALHLWAAYVATWMPWFYFPWNKGSWTVRQIWRLKLHLCL